MDSPTIDMMYKEFFPELPPVILLHGLTSSKETWDEIAPIIAKRTGFKVYACDTRNHGESEWIDQNGYDLMAEDLIHFMDRKGIIKAILVGHSMGGKIAMSFALKYPERVNCIVLEDISLHSPPSIKPYIIKYLNKLNEVLNQIPPEANLLEAKRFAANILSGRESDFQVESINNHIRPKIWDGSDLPLIAKEGGGFEWKTNVDGIYADFVNDQWKPVNKEGTYYDPVLLIYGTDSPHNVLDDKEQVLKHFPNTIYKPIEGGNHSLHIEYPELFTDLVCDFINEQRLVRTQSIY